jgi:hypothetical protein
MGVVLLSTPCSRISPSAAAPLRLTTEARVQHKAVKLMTKRRPKKVSLLQHIDHLVPESSLRRGSRRCSTRRALFAAPLTFWGVMPCASATLLGALSARRNAAWQRLRGSHPGSWLARHTYATVPSCSSARATRGTWGAPPMTRRPHPRPHSLSQSRRNEVSIQSRLHYNAAV